MTKLLLLDKDGTLVVTKSGQKVPVSPWDQELLPGVKESIARYVDEGWHPFIVANWKGIDRFKLDPSGYLTDDEEEEVKDEFNYVREDLLPQVEGYLFCPYPDSKTCHCCFPAWFDAEKVHYKPLEKLQRLFWKPNPGLLKLAIIVYEATEVLMVGRGCENAMAAKSAEVPFKRFSDWRNEFWRSDDSLKATEIAKVKKQFLDPSPSRSESYLEVSLLANRLADTTIGRLQTALETMDCNPPLSKNRTEIVRAFIKDAIADQNKLKQSIKQMEGIDLMDWENLADQAFGVSRVA